MRTNDLKLEQWTLGMLIDSIKKVGVKNRSDEPKTIVFDFAEYTPIGLCSWRGAYEELGILFDQKTVYADEFLGILENADGQIFQGWKGGDFKMSRDAPLWVSEPSQGSHTGVCGLFDEGFQLVILTSYFEY